MPPVDRDERGQADHSELLRERSNAGVFAAVERGGRVKATVLPSRRGPGLHKQAVEWVEPTSIAYTDECPHTTRASLATLKPSIRGTYRKVAHKRLQGYLDDFTSRYNERSAEQAMFWTLLQRAAE